MDIITTLLAAGVDPNAQMNIHRPSRGGNSGRFGEEQLNTGTTALFRAAQASDLEVIQALLEKGANPNINAMGFTPFLLVAGVSPGGGGGRGAGGGDAANVALMDLMIQHGADVNAQVTGTRTYSMRIEYHPPPDREGTSALHAAAQAGRADLVRYLLDKGAKPDLLDANGKKPIDLVGAGGAAGAGTAAAGRGAVAGRGAAAGPPAGAAGARGGGPANQASLAEIRTLLENAASKN